MNKVWIIVALLVLAVIPTPLITADTINVTVTLITSPEQYPMEKIEEERVYINQVLTEGHLPLLIEINAPTSISLNDQERLKLLTHKIPEQYGNKDITYRYQLLVNTTFYYQSPVFRNKIVYYNYTYFNNKTGKIVTEERNYNKTIVYYYELLQDFEWRWVDIKDLMTLEIGKQDFIIVDIVGNMKASACCGGWGVDVSPIIEIKDFKKEYKEYSWWDNAWNCSKEVMVNPQYINNGTSLYNFPILFQNISDDFKDNMRSDAYDLRVVTEGNESEYYFEIDYYDNTTGNLSVWINLTEVYEDNETIFWLYYSNSGADWNPSNRETWHTNYKGVYHMSNASGNIIDSTYNCNNGTAVGTPVYQQAGQVGYSIYYASNEAHQLDQVAGNAEYELGYEVEGWGRFDSGNLQSYSCLGDEIYMHSMLVTTGTRRLRHYMLDDAVAGNLVYSSTTYADNTWYHGISGWNDQYCTIHVWTDGADYQTAANSDCSVYWEFEEDQIGNDWSHSYGTVGYIDEMRYWVTGVFPDGWVEASFATVNVPHLFLNISEGTCPTEPPSINITILGTCPPNGTIGVCPCTNATCINVTIDQGTMNISFNFSINDLNNFTIAYTLTNVDNGTYYLCLCVVDVVIYNTTYYWWANITEYGNNSNYENTDTLWFTTAENPSYCPPTAATSAVERSFAEPIGIIAFVIACLCLIYLRRRK